ncbi:hypothetical protein [Mycoplasmoides pirum]|uniref:hypothetical protein n=1 Tax=Mycoplasmoides pirum TaxID=2122 RepID=UPI000486A3D3|nr:hypothetical protein [Mycoplasmoides pirum]
MILSEEKLISYLNSNHRGTKNFNQSLLVDKLYASGKKNKVISIHNLSTLKDASITCLHLLKKYLSSNQKNLYLSFYDVNKTEKYDVEEYQKLIEHIKLAPSNKKHVLVINQFNTFSNISWWIKEFNKLSKKYNLVIFLMLNELGFLFKNTYKRLNIPIFVLYSETFNNYLQNHSRNNINFDTYLKFLNSKILNLELEENTNLANQIIKKIISILWFDLEKNQKKRSDIHSCLELLRYVAFANESLFDLDKLSILLKINIQEIKNLLKILEETKIIHTLSVINKDLIKTLPNHIYIVFYDPIYYFAFNNALKTDVIELKLWISAFLNALDSRNKLCLVQDFYVPLHEQVSLYNSIDNSFYQIGISNNPLGPLMTYMKNIKEISKNFHFELNNLPNVICNYENQKCKNVQIN